jgi:hypothetical protein
MRTGFCNPFGTTLDNKLDVYYADELNGVVVECTSVSGYGTCTVLENLYPEEPINLFLFPQVSNGNLWVSDYSCNGYVWLNGVVKYTVGDQLEGITLSTANPSHTLHVYVGDDGACTSSVPHVVDLTDGLSLPTPFTGAGEIPGLTPVFQLTTGGATVYVTQDLT